VFGENTIAIVKQREWIDSYTLPMSEKPERILGDVELDPASVSTLSIFDDIDV